MATPYVEYTDESGNKQKLEFVDDLAPAVFLQWYNDYIKKHDPFHKDSE